MDIDTSEHPAIRVGREMTPRRELLVRGFLSYLADAIGDIGACADYFRNMKVDPSTVELSRFYYLPERWRLAYGEPEMTIHAVTEGPRDHVFEKQAVFALARDEFAVTYSIGAMYADECGGGATFHQRFRIGFGDKLENLQVEVAHSWVS